MADVDVENPPENMETEETPADEPSDENDGRAASAKSNANDEVIFFLFYWELLITTYINHFFFNRLKLKIVLRMIMLKRKKLQNPL